MSQRVIASRKFFAFSDIPSNSMASCLACVRCIGLASFVRALRERTVWPHTMSCVQGDVYQYPRG